ncbi:LysR family transcriptional regulator [bacterium]|nr:LysR family transcriptional regulator [bacterium]
MITQLNYHHFYYFWVIAREGSIASAAEKLKLSQPTLSTQLKSLEESLQVSLFERKNRRLLLTEAGSTALKYADEIFLLGNEFVATLQGIHSASRPSLRIGVIDCFPKMLTYEILKPLCALEDDVFLSCVEGKRTDLLTRLISHEIDLVISDAPVSSDLPIQAYSHLIGESGTSLLGSAHHVKQLKEKFPAHLSQVPVLLPTRNTMLRREIDSWLERVGVIPNVKAEFEDSALMKLFAQNGEGVLFLPTAIEEESKQSLGLHVAAQIPEIQERIYLISLEKRVQNPLAMLVLRQKNFFAE